MPYPVHGHCAIFDHFTYINLSLTVLIILYLCQTTAHDVEWQYSLQKMIITIHCLTSTILINYPADRILLDSIIPKIYLCESTISICNPNTHTMHESNNNQRLSLSDFYSKITNAKTLKLEKYKIKPYLFPSQSNTS